MNDLTQYDRLSDKIDNAIDKMHEYKIDTNSNISGLRLDIQTAINSINNQVNTINLKVEKITWKQRLITIAIGAVAGGGGAGIIEFLKKNI